MPVSYFNYIPDKFGGNDSGSFSEGVVFLFKWNLKELLYCIGGPMILICYDVEFETFLSQRKAF